MLQISNGEYIILDMISQVLAKKKLPDSPGVYFFLGARRKILYIGRATSLRNRVRSYFAGDILTKRSPWIAKMLPLIRSIDYRKTDSVLEAILLEADLIKKFQPPYNTDMKDDTSFNCVVITKEAFPRVLAERSKNIDFQNLKLSTFHPARTERTPVRSGGFPLSTIFGPFPHGLRLQDAMKIIRRIFPYRDLKCTPASRILPFLKGVPHSDEGRDLNPPPRGFGTSFRKGGIKGGCKPCFNRQIGLCPGVCTGEIRKEEYAHTIRNLRLFFEGKKTRLLKLLKKEMKAAVKQQRFEKANELKKTIFALQHIQDVALLRTSNLEIRVSESRFRLEAYDLSHFGGKDIVGAMTVVEQGLPRPSEYRLFKIRGITDAHEVAGLTEMLERRFNHPEWPLPQLIVVDGNDVQKSAAESFLASLGQSVPVVAVVKDEQHQPRDILGIQQAARSLEVSASNLRQSALLANSEAHRFVLKFQKTKREKFS